MLNTLQRIFPVFNRSPVAKEVPSTSANQACDVKPNGEDELEWSAQKSKQPNRALGYEFLVCEDITNGREHHKLPALSYKQHDQAPSDYHYVTEHIYTGEPVTVNNSLGQMYSCQCVDDCSDGQCACSSSHPSGVCYDSKGRLSRDYNFDSPEMIYECNAGCKCNKRQCRNTVIQDGSKHCFALFRTKSRGWGVRALENMKRGTFVGVYSGEIVSARDSCKRADDTYLFNLASSHIYSQQQSDGQIERDNQQFVCDAKFYGNFTRFINHSCEPNVIGIRSFTTHQDARMPYIAFFTNQHVKANCELTLNYGDNYWLVKCKRDGVHCLCKKPSCRFNKRTLGETMKQYKRQQQRNNNKQQQQQQQS